MSHARRGWWAVATGLSAALGVAACSSLNANDSAFAGDERPGTQDASGVSPGASADAANATGVVLVHAASFPSFRLCFSNFPQLVPQPDSRIMPESNVVGVEIGSLVRLDPMQAPGTVYVIPEANVRTDPGSADPPPKCGELVAAEDEKTARSLNLDLEYQVATEIDEPLGNGRVSVLAITGCGGDGFLKLINAPSTSCGEAWDKSTGNLEATTFDLTVFSRGANATAFPVQLFQMSPALESLKGDAGKLDVTYTQLEGDAGASDAGLATKIPIEALYEGGKVTYLTLLQDDPQVYRELGFRITTKGFSIDQSLATVQELSSPRELPTTYYKSASSYALLLLGDPAHKATVEDGGVNPKYNPRQAVHLLAVPVIDPATVDAGDAGGGISEPPGPSGKSDAG